MTPAQPTVLFDAMGPRGRRSVAIASLVLAGITAAFLILAIERLAEYGMWESAKWANALDRTILQNSLVPGFLNTLKAAAVAGAVALAGGFLIGLGRMSGHRILRWPATAFVQFFRAMPVLLLIWIPYLVTSRAGLSTDGFLFVVVGLALYNSAVLGEILRSGIRALPQGQAMAGAAVGLTHPQVLRLIVLPQALRNMLPAVLAQMVILLKDTSLGYIVTYPELVRQGYQVGVFYPNSLLQSYLVVAGVFFVLCLVLTRLVHSLDRRVGRHRQRGSDPAGRPAVEALPLAGATT